MGNILSYIQLVVIVILIVLVLVQQRDTALGSAFGQEGGFSGTMRGADKKIFWLTCFFGALFIILALLSHFYF